MMQFVKNLLIANKQNKYRPHIIRRHGLALALMLILAVQLVSGVQAGVNGSVLGYATNINQSDLLTYTNQNRLSNGLPAFSLNSKLNTAAQNKANHMIANDYWAHVAPDGTTPWYFFDQAGYAYLVAGENLAYGFDTSLGAVNGWMASPSHRDNILLPDYEQVGFGIANGENYQGGENTVVVAMYGDPVGGSSTPAATTPTEPVQSAPAVAQSEIVVETQSPLISEETPAKEDLPIDELNPEEVAPEPLVFLPSTETEISNFDALLNGSAGWALYATVSILGVLALAYLYRHITFINTVIAKGEQMIVAHPLLESSIIFAALWLLLTASYGKII